MRPILFDFYLLGNHITVISYLFFMVVAILMFMLFGVIISRARGISMKKVLICLVVMVVAVLLGSRLTHFLMDPEFYSSRAIGFFSLHGGFVFFGGLIITLITAFIITKLLKIDFWYLLDSLTPGIGFGLATMRVGCFLNGCCFGKLTTLPWGISFPKGSKPYDYYISLETNDFGDKIISTYYPLTVHPTQIYEIIFALLGALIVLYFINRKVKSGLPFLSFLLLYYIFRSFKWYLGVDETSIMLPYVFTAIILIITSLLLWRMKIFKNDSYEAK